MHFPESINYYIILPLLLNSPFPPLIIISYLYLPIHLGRRLIDSTYHKQYLTATTVDRDG